MAANNWLVASIANRRVDLFLSGLLHRLEYRHRKTAN